MSQYLSGARVDVALLQQLLRHLQVIGALCSRQCGEHHRGVARLVHVIRLAQTYPGSKKIKTFFWSYELKEVPVVVVFFLPSSYQCPAAV